MLVGVEHLEPGMRVAAPVFGAGGEVLLQTGVALTPKYIELLRRRGIDAVDVDLGFVPEVRRRRVLPDALSRALLHQARKLPAVVRQSRFVRRDPELVGVMTDVVRHVCAHPVLAATAAEIKIQGRYLFTHAVNVAVVAVMVGHRLGYGHEALIELGLGGLLHDVGKLRIEPHLIDKPGPLTEEEFSRVKEHTTLGFEMLFYEPRLAEVALQHHERWAGHGYPRGLRGEQIHPFAQIVGLADVFDAVTSDRVYRPAAPFAEALELIAGSGNYDFGIRYVEAFFECVSVYTVGTPVRLNVGGIAVVTENHPGYPLHPRVRLLFDDSGRPVDRPADIDLLAEPTIRIMGEVGWKEAVTLFRRQALDDSGNSFPSSSR